MRKGNKVIRDRTKMRQKINYYFLNKNKLKN